MNPPMSKPLSGEDAFAVTLLATCQAVVNILTQRLSSETDARKREKRKYWLEKLNAAIVATDSTYDGYVTEQFQNRFEKYHRWIETDINSLLKDYKEAA